MESIYIPLFQLHWPFKGLYRRLTHLHKHSLITVFDLCLFLNAHPYTAYEQYGFYMFLGVSLSELWLVNNLSLSLVTVICNKTI